MNIEKKLQGKRMVLIDTAPLIYFIEKHSKYFSIVENIFRKADRNEITLIFTPVTLAECLVLPIKKNLEDLKKKYMECMTIGKGSFFVLMDQSTSIKTGEIRAKYNFTLGDAMQIACAIETRCDCMISNDLELKRTTEIEVLVLDEFLSKKSI